MAEVLFREQGLAYHLSVAPGRTLTHPLLWWQFLTYGFVHDPTDFAHILFNMMGLWFLGRDVEAWYGTREFVRIYLVLLVFGSVVWATVNYFDRNVGPDGATLMGASGAVTGVVVLYALCFPRRILLFMFVLPMPAWVVGFILVGYNVLAEMGWFGQRGSGQDAGVAYSVHLAGAALAFVYYQQQWNFGRLLEGRFGWLRRAAFGPPPAAAGPHARGAGDRARGRSRPHPGEDPSRGGKPPDPQGTPHPGECQPRVPAPPARRMKFSGRPRSAGALPAEYRRPTICSAGKPAR